MVPFAAATGVVRKGGLCVSHHDVVVFAVLSMFFYF
jgi:hypothetical protein